VRLEQQPLQKVVFPAGSGFQVQYQALQHIMQEAAAVGLILEVLEQVV
jgi:hypothetical protein